MAQNTPESAELAHLLRTGPFHLALRCALTVRGLALTRVQHKLAQRGIKVGVTSLSYWQQGARRPQRPESLRAVRALEEVLDLPAHSLHRPCPGVRHRDGRTAVARGRERPAPLACRLGTCARAWHRARSGWEVSAGRRERPRRAGTRCGG